VTRPAFHNLALALVCAMAIAGVARGDSAESPPDRAPSFTLRDQFNDEHAIAFPRERPTVLALADRRGSSQLEGWLEPIGERYEGRVHIDGVADVRGVPGPLRWGVRQIFRRGSKTPIMLDWEDTLCTTLAYEKGSANLLVLDHDGRIVHRIHGEVDEDKLAALTAALEELLGE